MTGPAALRLRRPRSPPEFFGGPTERMNAPPVFATLGCRLNAWETEAMKDPGRAGRGRRRGGRQHLRRDRRGGAQGPAGDPPPPPRESGRPRRRHRLRRAGRARDLRRMPEVDLVLGNAEKLPPEAWTAPRRRLHGETERVRVDDIMAVTRDRRPPDRRLRHAGPRLRAGPERLRPPLHLLHHPLRPRQLALGAGRRRWWTRSRGSSTGLPRGGADRRRPHLLGRRPAGHAAARRPRRCGSCGWSPTCRACASPRSTRSRPTRG